MELLPVAVEVVRNHIVAHSVYSTLFRPNVSRLVKENIEASKGYEYKFPHLRITRKAFPPKTEKEIFGYQSFLGAINDSAVITDSAGSPMTSHSPSSPAAYSSPKAGTSAPLVR
jgi:hypothetical protein